jgi:hypothetical protein
MTFEFRFVFVFVFVFIFAYIFKSYAFRPNAAPPTPLIRTALSFVPYSRAVIVKVCKPGPTMKGDGNGRHRNAAAAVSPDVDTWKAK